MKILTDLHGCDKNLVDAEEMLPRLLLAGHTLTDDPDEADVILVHTCCFIRPAKEESIGAILSACDKKKEGRVKAVIVTGCMAKRYESEIRSSIPEADAVVPLADAEAVVRYLDALENGGKEEVPAEESGVPKALPRIPQRVITTGGLYEYLRIADGCDKHCTYCVIPKIRGPYRSVPMEKLLDQAEELASQGVKELILVAQETTRYGVDLYGEKKLHVLLKALCRIEGFAWIRILYCYPEEIYPELIETMAAEPKICHYLDLPVQHCDDQILRKMARRTTGNEIRAIVSALRERIPDIALRTTLIAGFPGETEEQHRSLVSFVREMRFARLGAFAYSKEEDTAAARMPGQVHYRTKERRQRELMEAQTEACRAFAQQKIGTLTEVLVEGRLPEEDVYVGRTYADAPEIDGYIFVTSQRELMTGDLVRVRVTGASDYDLEGVLEDGE